MTDKIIISRKEIERIVKQLQIMNVSIAQSTDDLRALLDKAEVSEPVGYKVTGKLGERCSFKSNEVKKGDIIYTSPPNQSAKIAELEAEIARLKGGNNSNPPTVQAALWTVEDEKRMDIIGQNSNEGLHYDSE